MEGMKFDIPIPPDDGRLHIFCITCKSDGVEKKRIQDKTVFICPNGHQNSRALYYGGVKFWIAEDQELWHESVGVFVRNEAGKYLFSDRTEFPFGLAVPAGHVDEHETAYEAAARELEEESGLRAAHLKELLTTDIWGDSCSGGADVHRWHLYGYALPKNQTIAMSDEGRRPIWLTIDEARQKEVPFLIAYLFEHFAEKLQDW